MREEKTSEMRRERERDCKRKIKGPQEGEKRDGRGVQVYVCLDL